jgi:hypothetical protein
MHHCKRAYEHASMRASATVILLLVQPLLILQLLLLLYSLVLMLVLRLLKLLT